MSAHTPTPWFISDHNRTKIVVTIKGNDLFWVVAETGFGPAVLAEANAAYIVECVNSHAELLATTAKLRELVHGAMALIEGPTLLTELNCDDWIRRARAALPTPSVTP